MRGFDEHTLEVLEYHKIISILKGLCLTEYGTGFVSRTWPMTDPEAIQTRLDEVSEMKDIIKFGVAFPLYRLEDTTELLKKSRTEGIFLEPKELLKIKELIEVTASLHDYARSEREKFPLIDEYLSQLHPFPEIRNKINKAIDQDGEILDSASSRLKQIRMDIGGLKSRIIARLNQILASRQKSPGWQDDTITQRDGRYVIPVIAGQFRSDSGIIHDRSQSGATLYVEPNVVVESNNRLGLLLQEERLEIDRILREITAMIGEVSRRLAANTEIIGILDLVHAAALLSINTEGDKPALRSHCAVKLIQSRHPLMLYHIKDKDSVIANDYSIDDSRLALIITGPNTGGKTVALKTVGLSVLMAQSGLHIPAEGKSEIGIFKKVFADIGDEQSIELSLSTFSSHVRQIIYAVRHADPDSLVLLDEIGAGTDPKEGSALAEAIILKLVDLKAKTIVTTHYSQLKTLPMEHPEIENASFEFDRKSLQPTFRLYTGIPGASYAVEIAQRLGMPADIAARASQLTGKGERSLTELIESLEKELRILRNDKATLEEKLANASRLERLYEDRVEEFQKDIDDARKEHLFDLENTLADARAEIEKLVKEIKESKASRESVKHAHRFLKEKKEKMEDIKARLAPKSVPPDRLEPGDTVWVESLKKEAEYVEPVGKEKARLRIGNVMTTVETKDLRKIIDYKKDKHKVGDSVGLRDLTAPGPEIHLRGMTVDEAKEALDKFLDSAIISGLGQAYVVHGKGTGALRKALSEFLKQHPAVKSIRLGNWNEGGAGVTVVQLK
jgi:DNA mismatch repair protein MutS2